MEAPIVANGTEYEVHARARKQMMWIGIVSMLMLFAGLTSAYVVAQGGASWVEVPVPSGFYLSTLFIALSSGGMFMATRAMKSGNKSQATIGLAIASVLGLAFVWSQFATWGELADNGFYFTGGEVASSYLYVLSGVHLAHMLFGIGALLVTTLNAARNKYSAEYMLGLELSSMFWHFLGVLWVYLLLFLLFIR